MEDPKFRQAMQSLEELKVEHPKPAMVRKIL